MITERLKEHEKHVESVRQVATADEVNKPIFFINHLLDIKK